MDNEHKNIKQIINNLIEQLRQWNYEYYVLNNSSVDDVLYDQKLQELINLEAKYPELSHEDSPTKKIGTKKLENNFQKGKHLIFPMLSLKNAFDRTDILHFITQIKQITKIDFNYFLEPKIDGLSISLSYQNGKLIRALTRGDGETGEIVTNNVYQIAGIPQKIKNLDKLEIRGEIYMLLSDFEKLNNERILQNQLLENENKKKLSLFANPRNAASGTLRQLDSSVVRKRNLQAFFFEILSEEKGNVYVDSQEKTITELEKIGFPINKYSSLAKDISQIDSIIEMLTKLRKNLDYEIDGIVIKINERKLYSKIGKTSKFPKWAIAYKFPAEIKETKILDIFATVGRTGRITYNAKLEPIKLLGTVVQRATLHNANYVKELDINIGDYVIVKKAGDIIPKVLSLSKNREKNNFKKWSPIEICPGCGEKLIIFKDEVDQYCVNVNCPLRILESLEHFCSRNAMNIEGLSVKQIEKFYNLGLIKNITDIYDLKNHYSEILKLEGYQQKSLQNLLNSIEKSKERPLSALIFALGIRYIGKKSAQDLAKEFKNIDKIISLTEEDLFDVKTFGKRKINSIINFFKNPKNLSLIEELKKRKINFKEQIKKEYKTGKFSGKKILITGKFNDATRNEIKEKLLELGAIFQDNFTKNLDYLIVAEKGSNAKISKVESKKIIYLNSLKDLIKKHENW